MLTTKQTRLDPSVLDRDALDSIAAAFSQSGNVAVIDTKGQRTELPEPVYNCLVKIIEMMHEGKAIIMTPEDEPFTTQAAANYLGVSRQHLVNLLEAGEIPFYRVGTHRRVSFKDLLTYSANRDAKRNAVLNDLMAAVDKEGLYFPNAAES